MTKANDQQVGGNHYKAHGTPDLQHWDIVNIFKLDYFQGNITKYVMRWRDKGGIEDLKKARHYLDKYIELENAVYHGPRPGYGAGALPQGPQAPTSGPQAPATGRAPAPPAGGPLPGFVPP